VPNLPRGFGRRTLTFEPQRHEVVSAQQPFAIDSLESEGVLAAALVALF
jgi:hypothetical protein